MTLDQTPTAPNAAEASPAHAPAQAVVIGEALVDVVGGEAFPGGSPLNVAVGLSRLGVASRLASRFGDDAHGALIAEHLRASHVQGAEPAADAVTSVAEVELDAAGHAQYTFKLDTALPKVELAGVTLLHTGSLGAVLEPGSAEVVRAFEEDAPLLRSYDPNIRPQLMHDHAETLAKVERLVSRSHVVKMSDEDAAWLYPELSADEVLAKVLQLGARLAILTRGAEGCLARAAFTTVDHNAAAEQPISVPAQRVQVADTIGAGDSFMSATLAAIVQGPLAARLLEGSELREEEVRAALAFAVRVAGITTSRQGANPPWAKEMTGA